MLLHRVSELESHDAEERRPRFGDGLDGGAVELGLGVSGRGDEGVSDARCEPGGAAVDPIGGVRGRSRRPKGTPIGSLSVGAGQDPRPGLVARVVAVDGKPGRARRSQWTSGRIHGCRGSPMVIDRWPVAVCASTLLFGPRLREIAGSGRGFSDWQRHSWLRRPNVDYGLLDGFGAAGGIGTLDRPRIGSPAPAPQLQDVLLQERPVSRTPAGACVFPRLDPWPRPTSPTSTGLAAGRTSAHCQSVRRVRLGREGPAEVRRFRCARRSWRG